MARVDDLQAYMNDGGPTREAAWTEMGNPFGAADLGFNIENDNLYMGGMTMQAFSALADENDLRNITSGAGSQARCYAVYYKFSEQDSSYLPAEVANSIKEVNAAFARLRDAGASVIRKSRPYSSPSAAREFLDGICCISSSAAPQQHEPAPQHPERSATEALESRLFNRSGGTWALSEQEIRSTKFVPAPDPERMEPSKSALMCGFKPSELYPYARDEARAGRPVIDKHGTDTLRYSRHGYFRTSEDIRAAVSALADRGVDTFVATEAQGGSQLGFWAATNEKNDYDLDISVELAVPWCNVGSLFNSETSAVFSRVDMDRALKHADKVVSFSSEREDDTRDIILTSLGGAPAPSYGVGMGRAEYAAANSRRNEWMTSSCAHAVCCTVHGVATISARDGKDLNVEQGISPQAISDALTFAVENGIRDAASARAFAAQVPNGNKAALGRLETFMALSRSTDIERAAAKLSAERAEREGSRAYGRDCKPLVREVKAVELGNRFDDIVARAGNVATRR